LGTVFFMVSFPCSQQPLTLHSVAYANGLSLAVLNLGQLALDGGAMFGVVPKTLWCQCMQPDDDNRVTLALNTLLLMYQPPNANLGKREVILIDTGVGDKFGPKHQAMYGIQHHGHASSTPAPQNPLVLALAQHGLTPADVTQVCYTHLHFDHAGGGTIAGPDGVMPLFPNARYRVHTGEWQHAMAPNERNKASYLPDNLLPLQQYQLLDLMEGDSTELLPDLLPGLRMQVTSGHTPYHQALFYTPPTADGAKGFVYWGDLIPTSHHVKIPYVMGYDEHPMDCMSAKKRWLQFSVNHDLFHVFEHDPEVPVAYLSPDTSSGKPNQYTIRPLLATSGGAVPHV
jgi:glyoxylase-like metal-dependent hydrolase (beta-lactamase superfamily II)